MRKDTSRVRVIIYEPRLFAHAKELESLTDGISTGAIALHVHFVSQLSCQTGLQTYWLQFGSQTEMLNH